MLISCSRTCNGVFPVLQLEGDITEGWRAFTTVSAGDIDLNTTLVAGSSRGAERKTPKCLAADGGLTWFTLRPGMNLFCFHLCVDVFTMNMFDLKTYVPGLRGWGSYHGGHAQ
jgi:hypothetical protein